MDQLSGHAAPFLTVLFRMLGVFLFAPVLGSSGIPVKARLFVGLTMTAAVYPVVGPHAAGMGSPDVFSLGLALGGEMLVGILIGLLAATPILMLESGGRLVGQQLGIGLGDVFNPFIETSGDLIGQMLMYMAIAAFISAGGLEGMFVAAAGSFEKLPPGVSWGEAAPMDVLLGLVDSGTELSLRVSAPVICIILIETVATALVMKTVPQLNIMTFGFPVKILAGITTMALSAGAIWTVIDGEMGRTVIVFINWAAGRAAAGVN